MDGIRVFVWDLLYRNGDEEWCDSGLLIGG